MEQTHNPSPGPGHNIPPDIQAAQRAKQLMQAAQRFLEEGTEIDANNEGDVSDFMAQLRDGLKKIEECRIAEKKPLDDQAREIQARYRDLKAPLENAKEAIQEKITKWLAKKQLELDAQRMREYEEAELALEAAEKAAANAGEFDFEAKAAVEKARKAAEKAAKAAGKAPENAKAKGSYGRATHLRTRYKGTIVDFAACLHHYRDEPWVREALERCISRDVNAKTKIHDIPGVKVESVHSAS